MKEYRSYEDELIDLVQSFTGKLADKVLLKVKEVINVGEPALGLEMLCDKVFDARIPLSDEQYLQIERLGLTMRMSPNLWDFLKKGPRELP